MTSCGGAARSSWQEAGEAAGPAAAGGAGDVASCPVTPASGRWLGYFDRHPYGDPYVVELHSGDDGLSGDLCIGGPPFTERPLVCAPLRIVQDRGRKLEFVSDLSQDPSDGYLAELKLTLSPDRTVLAGKLRLSDGSPLKPRVDGLDALFVREADDAVPDSTSCSAGEPSGECFLGPLRVDYIDPSSLVATTLAGGDIRLTWMNQRAMQSRPAAALFNAAADQWSKAQFTDDDSSGWEDLPPAPNGASYLVTQEDGGIRLTGRNVTAAPVPLFTRDTCDGY